MAVGTPERLIDELVRQGKRNLAVIANDTAMPRERYRPTCERGPNQQGCRKEQKFIALAR